MPLHVIVFPHLEVVDDPVVARFHGIHRERVAGPTRHEWCTIGLAPFGTAGDFEGFLGMRLTPAALLSP